MNETRDESPGTGTSSALAESEVDQRSAPLQPMEVDTRPLFARGETPCEAIDEGIAALSAGQALVLLVPFEPVPLYTKLGRQGFKHHTERLADGTWRVTFRR